jgi:hypothetical protein
MGKLYHILKDPVNDGTAAAATSARRKGEIEHHTVYDSNTLRKILLNYLWLGSVLVRFSLLVMSFHCLSLLIRLLQIPLL